VFANAGGDRTVIVGADTKFVATAYDRDRDVINYAKFFWNFGDGTTAEGPWVMHHYSYPGRYAVELTITNTSMRTSSRITVTAEPASVALVALPQGGVSVKNTTGRDLDISFWQIKQGEQTFTLPEYSVVLKDSSINIAAKTLGFEANNAKLFYPDGTEVVAGDEPAVSEPTSQSSDSGIEVSGGPAVYAPLITVASVEEVVDEPATTTEGEPLVASVAASDANSPWLPVVGLSGLVGVGIASVWAIRRRPGTPGVVEEFTIE